MTVYERISFCQGLSWLFMRCWGCSHKGWSHTFWLMTDGRYLIHTPKWTLRVIICIAHSCLCIKSPNPSLIAGAMLPWASLLCFMAGIMTARSSEWTVETNGLRVKEPSTMEGDFDAAIGDVCPHSIAKPRAMLFFFFCFCTWCLLILLARSHFSAEYCLRCGYDTWLHFIFKQRDGLQFGVPLYGASIQGQLKFVASNEMGCNAFHGEDFEVDGTNAIALVARGGEPLSLLSL